MIKIKLNHKLLKRPSVEELLRRGVLPEECYGVGGGKGVVAPSLVGTKRRVERERVKDLLRGWVEEWRRRGIEIVGRDNDGVGEQRIDVRRMARRFARDGNGNRQVKWGVGAGKKIEMPTRAKVLGLRRFWESKCC